MCAAGRTCSRVSQMRIVLSTEAEANTVSSVGLHCRSSTDASWPLHTGSARVASSSTQRLVVGGQWRQAQAAGSVTCQPAKTTVHMSAPPHMTPHDHNPSSTTGTRESSTAGCKPAHLKAPPTAHFPAGVGSHTCIRLRQSPEARRPATTGDQSIA